jgi:beta-galactosidase
VPNLYLVDDAAAAEVDRYVRAGGVVVMSFFSGIVDANDHVRGGPYPLPWAEMLGADVIDFYPYPEHEHGTLRTSTGESLSCDCWSEMIAVRGAQVIATYEEGPLVGGAAVLRRQHGAGEVFYIGTRLDEAAMEWLFGLAVERAGIGLPRRSPPGIEAVRRVARGASYLFLLNHTGEAIDLDLEVPGVELLSRSRTTRIALPPRDVAIIREDPVPQ